MCYLESKAAETESLGKVQDPASLQGGLKIQIQVCLLFFFFFFFFFCSLVVYGAPGPGIRLEPQPRTKPQQRQIHGAWPGMETRIHPSSPKPLPVLLRHSGSFSNPVSMASMKHAAPLSLCSHLGELFPLEPFRGAG